VCDARAQPLTSFISRDIVQIIKPYFLVTSMFWQESQALRDEVAGERRRADEARGELEKLFIFQRELRRRDRAGDRGDTHTHTHTHTHTLHMYICIYVLYIWVCICVSMYLCVYVNLYKRISYIDT